MFVTIDRYDNIRVVAQISIEYIIIVKVKWFPIYDSL